MKTKKAILCSLISAFVLMTGCSGGGGGGEVTAPTTNTSSTTPQNETTSTDSTSADKPTNGLFEQFAPPEELFASYLKIIEASEKKDFTFIRAEYAKGLKTAATKADNTFKEFSVNGTIPNMNGTATNVIENAGVVGLTGRNYVSDLYASQRVEVLDKIIQHIFIYSIRWRVQDIIQNHKISHTEDVNTIERAQQCSDYFFGGSQDKLRKYSIAYVSQTIDSENQLSSKTYDTIFRGLQTLNTYAKTDVNNVKVAQVYIDNGFYKMLYFATLQKAAMALDLKAKGATNALEQLTAAQFYYAGIMAPSKTNKEEDNASLKLMLSSKDVSAIDYNKLRKVMTQGFYESAVSEMSNAIKNVETDQTQAEINALSAKLYLDIITSSYSHFGQTRTFNTAIDSDISKFRLAINLKKANTAEAYKARIDQNYKASIN